MSHDIYNEKAIYGSGKPAWHKLGKVVEGLLTAEQCLNGPLNYEVEKVPALWQAPSTLGMNAAGELAGEESHVATAPGCYLTVAHWKEQLPTVLGMVGERYQVLQNRDAFRFFDNVVASGEAAYDAAGVLDEGRRIWVLAKLPGGTFHVGSGEDITETYLLLTTTHDGTGSTEARLTPVRVVCKNTLQAARSAPGTCFRIPHTMSQGDRIQESARLMGLARDGIEQVKATYREMARTPISQDERRGLIADTLGIDLKKPDDITTQQKGKVAIVGKVINGDPLADKRTVWGAYNGLTGYADHCLSIRGREKDPSVELKSNWFGGGASIKQRAFDGAMKLVAAAN